MTTRDSGGEKVKVNTEDYPALYQAADKASLDSQWWHLFVLRLYLFSLVFGSVFSTYSRQSTFSAIVALCLYLVTLGLALLQAFKSYDEVWYNGRAVAESVKTSAWRYMMRAEPYDNGVSDSIMKHRFCNDIEEILKQNKSLAHHLGGLVSTKKHIPEKMEYVRSLDVQGRLKIYNRERIDDQRSWYAKKYDQNKTGATRWFSIMVGLHALALLLLIFRVANPYLVFLPTEAIILSAGSALTWIQINRFKEHKSAYALTAHEIGLLKQGSHDVETESELSDFVKDAENAFSREHTQWAARRDTP